jgi:hypothetical protein
LEIRSTLPTRDNKSSTKKFLGNSFFRLFKEAPTDANQKQRKRERERAGDARTAQASAGKRGKRPSNRAYGIPTGLLLSLIGP